MTKVMVIDDSMAVRRGFSRLISKIAGVELLAEASNPIDAIEVFKKVGLPDLFILDIEMPKMDGITFLKKISQQRPIPVIICSTLVGEGSDAAVDALRYGAVEIIEKPRVNLESFFSEYQNELIEKISAAIKSHVNIIEVVAPKSQPPQKIKDTLQLEASKEIVAIGASTGGVQALEKIITQLKENHTGVVVTQHMPEGFTASFARRLNQIAPYSYVKEAQEDELVRDGQVLLAPGGVHMEIQGVSGNFRIRLRDFPKVNSHKPSITVLFKSVAKAAGKKSYGYLLTGMGSDGAQGLKTMHEAGAQTYGESEQSAVVYGMSRVAKEMGAIDKELHLDEIASHINKLGV